MMCLVPHASCVFFLFFPVFVFSKKPLQSRTYLLVFGKYICGRVFRARAKEVRFCGMHHVFAAASVRKKTNIFSKPDEQGLFMLTSKPT